MKAFENWDKVTPMYGGESNQLPAGGYVCRVKVAEETMSKSGKRMLEVRFDIAEGEYTEYYMEKYKKMKPKSETEPIKWPGTYYIVLEGENADARFKAFIETLEESNMNFKWDWDEKKLNGLLFGGIFGEEEFKGDRGVAKTTRLRYVRPAGLIRVGDYQIPEPKLLANSPFIPGENNQVTDDADELPF